MSDTDFNITTSAKNKQLLNNQRVAISRFLRASMAKHGLRFCDLPGKLKAHSGIELSEANLRSKINNGTISADLFLCLCELFDEPDAVGQISELKLSRLGEQSNP